MTPTWLKPAVLSLATFALTTGAAAQAAANYPDKPIRIVVPFAAGGSTDILARMAGDAIAAELKQPVVVENRAGASGNIGMGAVAAAAPDGYTLLFTSTNLTLNPYVINNVPYDPIKNFSGVTMLAYAPLLLITKPDFAGGSLESMLEHGKKSASGWNYASSGAGGAPHLAGEMLNIETKLGMVHVPYKGAAPALTDIAAGQVEMTFTTYVSARAMLEGNRLKALAVASKTRLPVLPDVKTFDEAGFKDFEFGTMFGLVAPKGTPDAVINKLYEALKKAGANPAFQKSIVDQGATVVLNTPADYDAYLLADTKKWDALTKKIEGLAVK